MQYPCNFSWTNIWNLNGETEAGGICYLNSTVQYTSVAEASMGLDPQKLPLPLGLGLGLASRQPGCWLWSSARRTPSLSPGPPSLPAGLQAWRASGEGCNPPHTALSSMRTTVRLTVGRDDPQTSELRVSREQCSGSLENNAKRV